MCEHSCADIQLSRAMKNSRAYNKSRGQTLYQLKITWRLLLESYFEDGQVHWMIKFEFCETDRPTFTLSGL